MARKISATLFITLDGVITDPHEWSFPFWNDEIAKFKDAELRRTDALLLGRTTYETFAAAWPQRKDDTGFADRFNSLPKFVVSATLNRAAWSGSEIVRPTDLASLIARLRKEDGGDVMAHGSATLVRSLIRNELLDELRLLVYPLVLGDGKRLFEGVGDANFKLVLSQQFSTGVVALIYERGPKIPVEARRAAMKAVLGVYSKKHERGDAKSAVSRRAADRGPLEGRHVPP
ncbi:MAG TPA: dihydrofolate reductase family protein [Thermoplasmata archaeon]|nr:dihydrofolate reductase family protein [Thermoplasmata archaeon]